MEHIEDELEAKSIERLDDDESSTITVEEPKVEEPKKAKKKRSDKQIAAFEKAKIKRAENIALKKKQKEEDKIMRKTKIKEIKEEKEVVEPLVFSTIQKETIPKPVVNTSNSRQPSRDPVINNYYYYGVPPPQATCQAQETQEPHYSKRKEKKSRKKVVEEYSSSSEEEEEEVLRPKSPPVEPDGYKVLQGKVKSPPGGQYQPPKPQLKFRFA